MLGDVLPILLYILGSILLVVLIILGIKLIQTVDRANAILDDLEEKSKEFYELIKKLQFDYTKEMIDTFKLERLKEIKEILYVLHELEKDHLQNILNKVKREELITLYDSCKNYDTDNFMAYYKKSIINRHIS